MIAIIGTSDRPCWLAEACKILLLLLLAYHFTLTLLIKFCKALMSGVAGRVDWRVK